MRDHDTAQRVNVRGAVAVRVRGWLALSWVAAGCYDLKRYLPPDATVDRDAAPADVADASADDNPDAPDAGTPGDVSPNDADASDVAGCASGTALCGGACVDPRTDTTHCGRCGNACAEGHYCDAGACRPPDARHVFSFASTAQETWSRAYQVALDRDGNLYLAGGVDSRAVDFGGGPLTGLFLVSFDARGGHRWSRAMTGAERPFFMSAGAGGQVTGAVTGSGLDLGGGVRPGNGTHLAAYDRAGTALRSRFAGSGGELVALEADDAGAVVLATQAGTWDFGGGLVREGAVFALDAAGAQRWSWLGAVVALAVDPVRGTPCALAAATGGYVVTCFDGRGAPRWSTPLHVMPSTRRCTAPTLAVGGTGVVAFTCGVYGAVEVGGRVVGNPTQHNTVLLLLSDAGEYQWGQALETNNGYAALVAADAAGNVYVAGQTGFDVSLGSGLIPAGTAFVASVTAHGAGRWSRVISTRISTGGLGLVDLAVRGREVAVATAPVTEAIYDFGGGPRGGPTGPSGASPSFVIGRLTQ
jgi:hypothetical protein